MEQIVPAEYKISLQGRRLDVTAIQEVDLGPHTNSSGVPCEGKKGTVMLYGSGQQIFPTVICDTCYNSIK